MPDRRVLAGETLDTLLKGRLAIVQRRAGYRVSLDAPLLARFINLRGGERIADLGAGSGVIAMLLASIYPGCRVTGLELQPGMVERAQRSVELNRLKDRVEIIAGDVRSVERTLSPGAYDAVVANPPYRPARSGRTSPDVEKRLARHEVHTSLKDFLRAGAYLMRPKGKMALVYPAVRAVDLLYGMRVEGIEPKRLRWVHSFETSDAALVLVEGSKGGRSELKVLPPLVVYARRGAYTRELSAMLEG